MNAGGFEIEPHWFWLIAAVVLGVAELLMPGVFLIWLAAAAALTGLAALAFEPPLSVQFVLFAVLALAATWGGRRWYLSNPVASSDPLLNDRAARLVGETVEVVEPIAAGRGRVKVGDGVWPARGPDAEAGACMKVVRVEGATLFVEPI